MLAPCCVLRGADPVPSRLPLGLQARKKRFNKLQEERSYWSKKKHGRKTDNERKKKAHHRPKH